MKWMDDYPHTYKDCVWLAFDFLEAFMRDALVAAGVPAPDAAIVAENSSVTVTDIVDGTSQYGEYIDSGLAPIGDNGSAGHGYSYRFAGNSATAPQFV